MTRRGGARGVAAALIVWAALPSLASAQEQPAPHHPDAPLPPDAPPPGEEEPPPAPAAPVNPLTKSALDPAAAPPNAAVVEVEAPGPVDVTVEGRKAAPGSSSLGKREIRDMPGVLGDPYRAIEVEPGVTPVSTGIPYYFIRGAPPGNVGYFYDGIQVPLLFHVGAGPSVIPPGIVQRVELHLGSYPAALGRLAGAVVEADSTPPRNEWHGEAAFRTVDLGGLVEGPLGPDATLLLGGHYSVGAAIVSALVRNVDLGYADYQGRLSIKAGANARYTVTTFGSYDFLKTIDRGATSSKKDDVTDTLLDSDFHRLDLRYDRDYDDGGKLTARVTLGLDRSRGEGIEHANDWRIDAQASIAKPSGHDALFRAGIDAQLDGYDIAVGGNPCPNGQCPTGLLGPSEGDLENTFRVLFPSRLDLAIGGWADTVIALGHGATLTPGIRVDYFNSLNHSDYAVDPRLVGRFGVGDHLTLVPAVGIASQLPGFAPIPALQIGGIPGGLQRSFQASFGAEVELLPFELRATGFRQVTFNLTDAIGDGRGSGFGTERFLSRSFGDGYGLELSAKGALRKDMFLLASYTLSRSTREKLGRTVPSAYDRTHVAQLALLFDLGKNWRAGVRNVFYSGFPADESGPDRLPSENPPRTRPFYRVDVRISKRWLFPKARYVGLVFDIQNATLSREVFDVTCDTGTCTPREIGPITIPTLAFECGF